MITHEMPLGRMSPLTYARLSRGISQRELEDAAGLARTAAFHFESGRRVPDPASQFRSRCS
jgi:transcriptional regulator with XRE-family HTH domain